MTMDDRNWKNYECGEVAYIGPDHSSLRGAMNLVKRIKAYWHERGEEKNLRVCHAASFDGADEPDDLKTVWGIREAVPPRIAEALAEPARIFEIGLTPRQRIKIIVERVAKKHRTTYDEIIFRKEGRGRDGDDEAAARFEAIRAVKKAFPWMENQTIANIFGYARGDTIGTILKGDGRRAVQRVAAKRIKTKELKAMRREFWKAKERKNHQYAALLRSKLHEMSGIAA